MTDVMLHEWCNGVLAGDATFRLATGQNADVRMAKIAARRLLELLPPADDATPISADWLKAVGFESDPTDSYMVRLQIPTETGYPAFMTYAADPQCEVNGAEVAFSTFGSEDTEDAADEMFVVVSRRDVLRTRGHVRGLCSALGVTLAEPKS